MERKQHVEHMIGGMQEDDWSPRSPAAARLLENMERGPDGLWRTMPGVVQATEAPGAGGIIGLCWFQPRPNQRWLVLEEIDDEDSSLLRYVSWPTGAPVTFARRARVAGRPASSQFLQVGRWLYHFNGIERPIRWDGDTVQPVGYYGTTPAPTVNGSLSSANDEDLADAAAAVLVTAGTPTYVDDWQRGVGELPADGETERFVYAYGMTLVNDLGQESPMSPLVYARGVNDNTSDNYGLRSNRLQIPALDRSIRGVRLWRTPNLVDAPQATAPQLYHLASFSCPGGFDYIDHAPDAELGEARIGSAYGPVPLGARCAAFHHHALWLAVDHQVWASAPTQHEVFPPTQRYDVGGAGSGHIIALWSVPRGLVVVKTRGVWMVKGTPAEGYRVETVSERAECAGPRALAYVEGVGLLLVTGDGPAVLIGTLDDDETTRLVPLAGIRKTWRRLVSPRALHNALVVHRAEVSEVWFHVPRMGETKPTLGLVYHYGGPAESRGWSIRTGWLFSSATTYQGRTWLGSHDTSDASTRGVFLLTRGGVSAVSGSPNTPPDPSVPVSPTYSEPYPIPASGTAYAFLNLSGDPVVSVWESGQVETPQRTTAAAAELVGVPTGAPDAFDVQARFGRELVWRSTDDEEWRTDSQSEQPDEEDDPQFRPRWGVSSWDEDGMWGELEPGAVLVPLPLASSHVYQIRVRGLDLRLAGLRVWVVPESPARAREVT